MQKLRTMDSLPLDGGVLCFHFINTVNSWKGNNLHEYFSTYEEVIKWCAKVDIINTARRKKLSQFAKEYPLKAKAVLQQIKEARELLYQFFSIISAHRDKKMPVNVLDEFNSLLSDSLANIQFDVIQNKVELSWSNTKTDLLEPVWMVMKSAYDILTINDRLRIKECSKCGWIFMDQTKNNKRRWCNPATCGTTEKAKKYYQKKRKAQLGEKVKKEN